MHRFTNELVHETSPYLLQHAHNPVDWNPWSLDALKRAKEENKPVLVSIGYAACHWCHVMERESFENEDTAAFMNQHFINIKIDREERPDLDHIYMDAVQAMTGSGGWPLNVFLTPEGRPFYGGTYFPPVKAFNRPSWLDVLGSIALAFRDRREEIEANANNLVGHLLQSNAIGSGAPASGTEGGQDEPNSPSTITRDQLDTTVSNILQNADRDWGGFGKAPKFPQTFTIQYLLRYSHVFGIESTLAAEARSQALLSLDRMIQGGIYDQLGGGFARYSTDVEWLAPHFEKMLYDNALLLSVISEAYQVTQIPRYKEVIKETMAFITREFLHPDGGFYAALDADSEGEEGKFYVWNEEDIEKAIPRDAEMFCSYFDITEEGNWSETPQSLRVNILRVRKPLGEFAAATGHTEEEMQSIISRGRTKLMEVRDRRVRPGLDDKVILGWNALMNTAASKAFTATGEETYRLLAIRNMEFLLANFQAETISEGENVPGAMHHTWKNNVAKYPAFLDDYAYLIEALLQLQEITGEVRWLRKADDLAQFVLKTFTEEDGSMFYFTGSEQDDVIIRKKEVYDGAVPSGNAVMSKNLLLLGLYFDRPAWTSRAAAMIEGMGEILAKYPTSFGIWNSVKLQLFDGSFEIAVVQGEKNDIFDKINMLFIPHKIIMYAQEKSDYFPLLAGRYPGTGTDIYVCRNYACLQPVSTLEAFSGLINSGRGARLI